MAWLVKAYRSGEDEMRAFVVIAAVVIGLTFKPKYKAAPRAVLLVGEAVAIGLPMDIAEIVARGRRY